MKNPFLKYVFTCKHCGRESNCRLPDHSKKRLLRIVRRSALDQRCTICGHEANYHFNRLYTKPRVWPVVLIWILAFTISYLSGVSLYERFGDLDGQFDSKIQALFFAVVAPLAIAGLLSFRIWNSDSRFNEPVSPLMLEGLKKY